MTPGNSDSCCYIFAVISAVNVPSNMWMPLLISRTLIFYLDKLNLRENTHWSRWGDLVRLHHSPKESVMQGETHLACRFQGRTHHSKISCLIEIRKDLLQWIYPFRSRGCKSSRTMQVSSPCQGEEGKEFAWT